MSQKGKLAVSFGVSLLIVFGFLYLASRDHGAYDAGDGPTAPVEESTVDTTPLSAQPEPEVAVDAEESPETGASTGRELLAVGGWTLVGRVVENPQTRAAKSLRASSNPAPTARTRSTGIAARPKSTSR